MRTTIEGGNTKETTMHRRINVARTGSFLQRPFYKNNYINVPSHGSHIRILSHVSSTMKCHRNAFRRSETFHTAATQARTASAYEAGNVTRSSNGQMIDLNGRDPVLLKRLHAEFVEPLFNSESSDSGTKSPHHCTLRWMNILQALSLEKDLPGRPTILVLDPFLRGYSRALLPALMNWVQREQELRELAVIAVQTVDSTVVGKATEHEAAEEFRQFVVEMRQNVLQNNFAKPVAIASRSIADIFGADVELSQVRFILLDHNGNTCHYFQSFQELKNDLLQLMNRLSLQCIEERRQTQLEEEMGQERDQQTKDESRQQQENDDIAFPIDDLYYKNPYLENLDFVKSRTFTRTDWQSANMPLERLMQPHTLLRFPSYITANYHDSTLFISDSHHNRILILDRVGRILDCIGSGKYNRQSDGDLEFGGITYQDADLARPNGICVLDQPSASSAEGSGVVYFADTGTHSIKCIDLKTKQVSLLFDLQFINRDETQGQRLPYRDRLYQALKQKFIFPSHRMSSTFHMDEVIAAKADLEFEMERLERAASPIPLLCDHENDRIRRPLDVFIHYGNDDSMVMYIVDESYECLWRVANFYNHIDHKANRRRKNAPLRLERVTAENVRNMDGFDAFEQQYLNTVLIRDQEKAFSMLPERHMLIEYLFLKHVVASNTIHRHRAYAASNCTYHICPLDPQRMVKIELNKDKNISVSTTILERGISDGPLSPDVQSMSPERQGAALNHPTSIAVLGDHMFISDTNNHLVRKVELPGEGNAQQCRTLKLHNFRTLGFPTMEYRPYLSSDLELKNINYGMDRITTPESSNPHLNNSMLGFGRVVQIPLEMSLGIDLISLDIKVPSTRDYEFASPIETFNVHSSGPWIHYREAPQLLFLKWKTNPPGVPSIKYPRPLAYAFKKEELYDLLYPNNSAKNDVNTINIPFIASGIIGVGEFVIDTVVYLRKKDQQERSTGDNGGDISTDLADNSHSFRRAPFYSIIDAASSVVDQPKDESQSEESRKQSIINAIRSPIDTKYFHKNLQTRHVHKWNKGEMIVPQVMEVEEMEQVLIDQHENNREWNPQFFKYTERERFEHHEDLILIDYIQVRLGVSTDGGQEHKFPIKTRVSVEANVSLPHVFVRNDFKRQHICVPDSWPDDPCLHLDTEAYNRDPEYLQDIADIGAYTGLISPYPDDKLTEAVNEEDFLPVRVG